MPGGAPKGSGHRHRVAVHEAGHALVCSLAGVKVVSVTVAWKGTSHGALVHKGSPPPDVLLRILLAGESAVALAGREGWFEETAEPTLSAGVVDVATREPPDAEVTSDDESIAAVLEQLWPGDAEARQRALMQARAWVEAAIEQHAPRIRLVADALLQETTLRGRALRRIIDTKTP